MPSNGQYLTPRATNGYTNGNRILDPVTGLPWNESDKRGGPESGFAMPHVLNFGTAMGGAWKTYYKTRFDEAMRAGRSEALAMEMDAFLIGIFNERRRGTSSLKWNIEVENEQDPWEKALKDGLTRIIRNTWRFKKLINCLLWGIWYGRQASECIYEYRNMDLPDGAGVGMSTPGGPPVSSGTGQKKRRALVLRRHKPVRGDKITHHWDGTPAISVNSSYVHQIPGISQDDIVTTDDGTSLVLRGMWRQRYIIHSHEWMDGDFFDPDSQEAVHGVGIRHFLYWLNSLRLEWISNIADWCQRTGLGVRLWYYQGGNKASKDAVEQAAYQQSDRTNILVPRYGERAVEGVDYIDTASNGADLLLRLQQHIESVEERFIIGQTLSANTEGHGLGGSGVASMHSDTKVQIIEDDAIDLGETITEDNVNLVKRFTYPELKDIPARLVPAVDEPDPGKKLESIRTFVDMGGEVAMDETRGIIGLRTPKPGEAVLKRQEVPQLGMPGAPGEDPAGGDAGNPFSPEEQSLLDEIMGDDGGDEPEVNDEPEQFAFDESKHKRGQPQNKGEFGPGGGGGASGGAGGGPGPAQPQIGAGIAGQSGPAPQGAPAPAGQQELPHGIKPHDVPRVKEILAHYMQAKKLGLDTPELREKVKAAIGGDPESKQDKPAESLHDTHANFKDLSHDEIKKQVADHFAGLSAEQARQSLKDFGIEGAKSKKQAIEMATRKISERKESWERGQAIEDSRLKTAKAVEGMSPSAMLAAAKQAHAETGAHHNDPKFQEAMAKSAKTKRMTKQEKLHAQWDQEWDSKLNAASSGAASPQIAAAAVKKLHDQVSQYTPEGISKEVTERLTPLTDDQVKQVFKESLGQEAPSGSKQEIIDHAIKIIHARKNAHEKPADGKDAPGSDKLKSIHDNFRSLSYDQIDKGVKDFFAGLSTSQAKQAMKDAFDMKSPVKSKEHAIEQAIKIIRDRKGALARVDI